MPCYEGSLQLSFIVSSRHVNTRCCGNDIIYCEVNARRLQSAQLSYNTVFYNWLALSRFCFCLLLDLSQETNSRTNIPTSVGYMWTLHKHHPAWVEIQYIKENVFVLQRQNIFSCKYQLCFTYVMCRHNFSCLTRTRMAFLWSIYPNLKIWLSNTLTFRCEMKEDGTLLILSSLQSKMRRMQLLNLRWYSKVLW